MTATIAFLCLGTWFYLFFLHGGVFLRAGFWRSIPELEPSNPPVTPAVDIVVPARDEAETIGRVMRSLVAQNYSGAVRIVLVDDGSSDGTAGLAGSAPNMRVLSAAPKPSGWSGKLWALDQGVTAGTAPLIWFTDADIVHDPRHLSALVTKISEPGMVLVSEMVRLNCESRAERILVPAFVYFFQMLYPFARVNDPRSKIAAAAGGSVLIRREALQRLGGIAAIKDALIDDVTLAAAAKRHGGIYLGHSMLAASIRRYPYFADLWVMIARTAFTQLRYSSGLLLLTLLGLTLVWWAPLILVVFADGWPRLCGLCAFALGAISYLPTLKRYDANPLWSLALPVIALFYMAATAGSAVQYWRGTRARWKNRDYGRGAV